LVGQFRCGTDQFADDLVGAQRCPQLLLGTIGGLRAQHDAVAFELGLERAEGVLDLPAGVVQLGQLGGRCGLGVDQGADQREGLGRGPVSIGDSYRLRDHHARTQTLRAAAHHGS